MSEPIRVLFVDDSRTARSRYARLLRGLGYGVQAAASVAKAQALLEREPFDLAIVDFLMPEANGDALCRLIRAEPRWRHMPAAILTASYSDDIIRASLAAGASDCLFKDEPEELLVARIEAMVRSIEARRTLEVERRTLVEILGSLSEGVYGVGTDGRLRFMNPAGLRLLGYPREAELIGRTPHEAFHGALTDGRPNPTETCFLTQAYELGDELLNWESVFWTRDRRPLWVECNVVPFRVSGRREGSVVAFRDITQLREDLEVLNWQAYHDSLTRLPNRRFFRETLAREFHRLRRGEETGAVLYIDLDRFKRVNDESGHAAGDRLLAELGAMLARRLRTTDVLARLGGDEFGVILPKVTVAAAHDLAGQLLALIAGFEFCWGTQLHRISASIGLAMLDRDALDPEQVLGHADAASYRAKRAGGAQVMLHSAGVAEAPRSRERRASLAAVRDGGRVPRSGVALTAGADETG